MLASALIPALLFSTALAQYTPSVNYYLSSIEATGEGFCPGRSPPPLKQRQCAAFHTLAVCSNNPAQNCRVAMDGILASIQSDNTTWACVTTNNVTAAALGVVCGAGGAPPCTAEVVVESVDVDCKAQNWFKRWFQGTGWNPVTYHFGQTLSQCVVNASAPVVYAWD